MSADVYGYAIEQKIPKGRIFEGRKKKQYLASEDIVILSTLERLQKELKHTHISLEEATDQDLIDSYIYELNALNMRYKFYLQMCKDKGLVAAIF
ncbi:MAG: YaaL family protein [Defluviitaleaceae bacterium]|nr:YaaL family protein [Defluviitaleaceae bacterium]